MVYYNKSEEKPANFPKSRDSNFNIKKDWKTFSNCNKKNVFGSIFKTLLDGNLGNPYIVLYNFIINNTPMRALGTLNHAG